MIAWEDISAYGRGDVDRSPNAFVLRFCEFRVTVHKHKAFGDRWLLTCDPWFRCAELQSPESVDARREGLDMVRQRMKKALKEIDF